MADRTALLEPTAVGIVSVGRSVLFAKLRVIAVALVVATVATSCADEPRRVTSGCAVTLPSSAPVNYIAITPLPADRFAWYGNDALAADLPKDGTYRVPAANSDLGAKVAWWRFVGGDVLITAERLDGEGRVTSRSSEGYGGTGFAPSGIPFSSEGCWRIVGSIGARTLEFTMNVRRALAGETSP